MSRWRTAGSLLLAVPVAVAFQLVAAPPTLHQHRGSQECCQVGRNALLSDPISPQPSQPCTDWHIAYTRTHTCLFAGRKTRGAPSSSDKERSWLRWLDARLEETPVGELGSTVMKNFHPIMNIYAKRRSSEGADMANKLMRRIIDEVDAGNSFKLKTNICNTVLSAWAKSGRIDASEEATKLLIWMSRMSREKKHDVKPNTISYSTVIDSWARSGAKNSAQKAEAILELMQKEASDAQPNTITFNSVINAWAKSNAMDKAVHAEALWSRMEDLNKAGNEDVRPDVWTYQALISAWSSSNNVPGAPQRCEELLQVMDEKYKGGDESVKPNALCFTAAITAWSKSKDPNKHTSAYRVLQFMDKLYQEGNSDVKPNVVAYTAALNACAYPPEDEAEMREYFDTALLVMEELGKSEYGVPNYITYATMLKVCSKCLPKGEELDSIVRKTFHQCCRDGQVGDVVLMKLQRRYPELSRELLADQLSGHGDELSSEHLPREWRSNVKGERKPPRRKNKRQGKAKHIRNGGTDVVSQDSTSKFRTVRNRRGSRELSSKESSAVNTEPEEKETVTGEETSSWRDRAKSLDESAFLL